MKINPDKSSNQQNSITSSTNVGEDNGTSKSDVSQDSQTSQTQVKKKKASVAKKSTAPIRKSSRKKRIVEDNDFDHALDRGLIFTLSTAKARRQQNKVLKAIQDHLNLLKSFNEHADPRILTMVTEHLKIASEMKLHTLSEIDKKLLLVRPQVFQPDHIVDPKRSIFMDSSESYREYIQEMEEEAKKSRKYREKQRNLNNPFLTLPDVLNIEWKKCAGCDKQVYKCHDVLYGPLCMFEVIEFCNNNIDWVDDTVVKKIFIDTYNRALRIDTFRDRRKTHDDWIFPPPCMQDNSYDYIVFWYEWMIEREWRMVYLSDEAEDDEDEDEEVESKKK